MIKVEYTAEFKKGLKSLFKKHKKIKDDIDNFISLLESGETPGVKISNKSYTVYKARVKNSSTAKGKSSGFRIIFYIKTEKLLILLMIYTKNKVENISDNEIHRIIDNDFF